MTAVQAALWIAIQSKRCPVLLIGRPGSGKSSHVTAGARVLKLPSACVIGSVREPSDMAGLPIISKQGLSSLVELMQNLSDEGTWEPGEDDGSLAKSGVVLAPPRWAVKLSVEAMRCKGGVLFLDELPDSTPAMQAAMLRVVLDNVVGDLEMPKSISVVAAGNRGRGWELTSALANRFLHLDWNPTLAEFIANRGRKWPDPVIPRLAPGWEKRVDDIMMRQNAYLLSNPTDAPKEPEEESRRSGPWCSERQLDVAAYVDAAAQSINAEKPVRRLLYNGLVGQEFTRGFFEYEIFGDLPNPHEVLKARRLNLMDRNDKNYVALCAVVNVVKDDPTPKNWENAWHVLASVAEQKAEEVGNMVARRLVAVKKPSGAKMPIEQMRVFLPVMQAAGKVGV